MLVLLQAKVDKELKDEFQRLYPYWGASTYLIECALRAAIEQKKLNPEIKVSQLDLSGVGSVISGLKVLTKAELPKEEPSVRRPDRRTDDKDRGQVESKPELPKHGGSKGHDKPTKGAAVSSKKQGRKQR